MVYVFQYGCWLTNHLQGKVALLYLSNSFALLYHPTYFENNNVINHLQKDHIIILIASMVRLTNYVTYVC